MTHPTVFIWNPIAGTKRADPELLIRRVFPDSDQARVVRSEYSGHAMELAQEAAAAGAQLVVAVGGDGTLNEVSRGLLNSSVDLGHIPRGSGNAFARAMGIPLNPGRACRSLRDYRPRAIDVGKIGGELFLVNAGIGLDAEVCRRLSADTTGRRGLMAYVGHTLAAVRGYRPDSVRVRLEEEAFEVRSTFLNLANTSQFGNGVIIAPHARPEDGLLDLCILNLRSAWDAVPLIPRLFLGSIHRYAGFHTRRFRRLQILRSRPGVIQVDGESREAAATLDVEVLPAAIRVALPAQLRNRSSDPHRHDPCPPLFPTRT